MKAYAILFFGLGVIVGISCGWYAAKARYAKESAALVGAMRAGDLAWQVSAASKMKGTNAIDAQAFLDLAIDNGLVVLHHLDKDLLSSETASAFKRAKTYRHDNPFVFNDGQGADLRGQEYVNKIKSIVEQ